MAARLIVNADDFGLTTRVNDGVLEAHGRGILTSASIMPVGRAFDHAARLARETPALDIGIHLTLVEERPLLPGHEIPSLVGPEGRFLAYVLGPLEQAKPPIFIVLNAAPEEIGFKLPMIAEYKSWMQVLNTTEGQQTNVELNSGAETRAPPCSVLAFAGLA